MHKDLVLSAGYDDVVRTLIFSGRPMSVRKTPYVAEWSVFASSLVCFFTSCLPLLSSSSFDRIADSSLILRRCYREDKRSAEIRELCAQGKIPHEVELQSHPEKSAPGRQCTIHIPEQMIETY